MNHNFLAAVILLPAYVALTPDMFFICYQFRFLMYIFFQVCEAEQTFLCAIYFCWHLFKIAHLPVISTMFQWFGYTFISATEEAPSSPFFITFKNIPSNFLSHFQFTHLLSLPLPSLSFQFISPSSKKPPVPPTSPSCTSPSSVYKGSS